jgi:5S rRNA maturation endonuclease (ribonuclease M5)
MSGFNYKSCLICKGGVKNDCLYYHKDSETGDIWLWCQGKCQRGYHLFDYCYKSGLSVKDFLNLNINFEEARLNEVNAMGWPKSFLNLSDPKSSKGVAYLKSRGLEPAPDMYYDSESDGIVLAYYMQSSFVGAQVRFIEPKTLEDGSSWKITTMPGTRLGYLFWGWSQNPLPPQVKYVVVTEGAFNAATLQQCLNKKYGSILSNPYRCIAASGSGASAFQKEKLKELVDNGIKVIIAADNDDAGMKMLEKLQHFGSCTHYAISPEDGLDWNDLLVKYSQEDLLRIFLKQLRRS